MVREKTGHPPSCAEVKKMRLLTLLTHGCCPMASFFFFYVFLIAEYPSSVL